MSWELYRSWAESQEPECQHEKGICVNQCPENTTIRMRYVNMEKLSFISQGKQVNADRDQLTIELKSFGPTTELFFQILHEDPSIPALNQLLYIDKNSAKQLSEWFTQLAKELE